MRLVKAFVAGIAGLFIIITLFSLLIPSRVRVSRAVLINNTNSEAVYQQIANFENWKQWHPIFTLDSAKLYLGGPTSGCVILQRGKEVKLKLISADSTSIKFLLQADGENDIDNDIVISKLPSQNSLQVEWRAITKLHWYPWEKFYGIFIDKLTGPGYEAALDGLKDYLEKHP
ncbi:MAG: hypothetical protein ABIN01_00865 [Ferruginibacter sp.]